MYGVYRVLFSSIFFSKTRIDIFYDFFTPFEKSTHWVRKLHNLKLKLTQRDEFIE